MNITIADAAERADLIIASEVSIQDKMWGDANERADAMKGQLLLAGHAQLSAIRLVLEMPMEDRKEIFAHVGDRYYPKGWTGFRDYGSDIANLAVAAAYIRNEIKRRILKGESTERTSRPKDQPYVGDQPNMSSSEAA
jgi:hypothetical protein